MAALIFYDQIISNMHSEREKENKYLELIVETRKNYFLIFLPRHSATSLRESKIPSLLNDVRTFPHFVISVVALNSLSGSVLRCPVLKMERCKNYLSGEITEQTEKLLVFHNILCTFVVQFEKM